jgi:uncharacterized protein
LKYLLVLVVVIGVLWLMSVQRRISRHDDPEDAPRPPSPAPESRAVVPVVACARCGVHLPESDALRDGEHVFCSRTHQLLGPKRRRD